MTDSKRIAGLLGPTLIAVTVSETINLNIWATTIAPVVYLNGALLFVAGVAIVRDHNRWTAGWPVLVTLLGWLGIVAGLARMMVPVLAQRFSQNSTSVLISTGVLFLIGLLLTFKAYGKRA